LAALWARGETIPMIMRAAVYEQDALGRLTLVPAT
jgi:hypothetical protein